MRPTGRRPTKIARESAGVVSMMRRLRESIGQLVAAILGDAGATTGQRLIQPPVAPLAAAFAGGRDRPRCRSDAGSPGTPGNLAGGSLSSAMASNGRAVPRWTRACAARAKPYYSIQTPMILRESLVFDGWRCSKTAVRRLLPDGGFLATSRCRFA